MRPDSLAVLSAVCDELARSGAPGGPDPRAVLGQAGPLLEWVQLNETGDLAPDRVVGLRPPPVGTVAVPPLEAAPVETYLRRRFDDPGAVVHELQLVVGGFSKRTAIVVATVGGAPLEFVIRQVVLQQQDAANLAAEYASIRFAWSHGLPVPEPLWIDAQVNGLGGPFFATARARGVNPGDVFGASGSVPSAVAAQLAAFLAGLHALDTDGLTTAPAPAMHTEEVVRAEVEAFWGHLTVADPEPAASVVAVFEWLRAHVPATPARAVLVHGDVGYHNVLVAGDRLSAVLDWERSHLGDPAEDLAYLKPTLAGLVPWDDFLAAYRDAGGASPDPASERFYRVWQDVWRYVSCVRLRHEFATSGRLSSAFAGYIFGPRFPASALAGIEEAGSPEV